MSTLPEDAKTKSERMKHIFAGTFILLFFCSFLHTAQAQSGRYSSRNTSSDQHFSVGLAPLSLLLPGGKVNIHGEWAYADNKSISVLIGIPRGNKAANWLSNDVALNDNDKVTTNKFHAFGVAAEHRFYFSENAPRGLYVAPYARYNRIWLDHITENTDNQGETKITGALSGFGFGGAVGWQFRLGEHMTMDATVAGVDLKWMRGTLIYASTDPDNDIVAFRDKVQDAVGDLPLIGSKLVAEIDGNSVKAHSPGWVMPSYRFNLTVNYVF